MTCEVPLEQLFVFLVQWIPQKPGPQWQLQQRTHAKIILYSIEASKHRMRNRDYYAVFEALVVNKAVFVLFCGGTRVVLKIALVVGGCEKPHFGLHFQLKKHLVLSSFRPSNTRINSHKMQMLAGNVDVCWLTCVIPVGSGQVLTGGPVLTAQVCSNEPATQCGGSHDTPFIGLSPIGTER